MHLTEGQIRAFLDDAVSAQERQAIQQHLATCRACQLAGEAMSARAHFVQRRLSGLEGDSPWLRPMPVQAARRQLSRRLNQRLAQPQSITFKEKLSMFKQSFTRISRSAWAVIVVVAVLALVLAFPTTRALANEFLALFRVQQVRVLPVDMNKLPGEMAPSASLEALFRDRVEMQSGGEPEAVADAQTAAQMAGLAVRLPAALQDPALYVQKGGDLSLTLDTALINNVMKDMGHAELKLPAELDGRKVNVSVASSVIAMYGDCPDPTVEMAKPETGDGPHSTDWSKNEIPACIVFMQMPSPTIEAPQELDMNALGQVYLELLGMDPDKAADFAKTVDWTNTFVLPMPSELADYKMMTVDGVPATFIRTRSQDQRGYMLLWIKDGVVYSLTGPGGGDAALDIANSIR